MILELYVYAGYSLIIAWIYKIDRGICINKEKPMVTFVLNTYLALE